MDEWVSGVYMGASGSPWTPPPQLSKVALFVAHRFEAKEVSGAFWVSQLPSHCKLNPHECATQTVPYMLYAYSGAACSPVYHHQLTHTQTSFSFFSFPLRNLLRRFSLTRFSDHGQKRARDSSAQASGVQRPPRVKIQICIDKL